MRQPIRFGLTVGAISTILALAVILLLAATTWLDFPLGMERHRAITSDLSIITVDGRERTVLLPPSGEMMRWGLAWSHDAKSVVYSLGTLKTYVLSFAPGNGTKFALGAAGKHMTRPIASRGGDDVEAEVADLQGRGLVFAEYDEPGYKTVSGIHGSPSGNAQAAYFRDSDGNLLGLVHHGPCARVRAARA